MPDPQTKLPYSILRSDVRDGIIFITYSKHNKLEESQEPGQTDKAGLVVCRNSSGWQTSRCAMLVESLQ